MSSTPQISHQRTTGGGTAGCPLAATLSEYERVLVLERGGVPYGKPNLMTQEGFLTTLMEVLSTPRCKPEPPKTASPMPEAGFLTAVVLSMPGSIVEPINNSTEGQGLIGTSEW